MANKENMLLWVQALESGQFTQGRERLKRQRPDGTLEYCCLGVACEVAFSNGVVVNQTVQYAGQIHEQFRFDDKSGYLPESVQDWLEVEGEDLLIESNTSATYANDTDNLSFLEIAAKLRSFYDLGPKD